jgi:voltage-gated potassium channel
MSQHHKHPPPPPSKARLLLQLLGQRLKLIGSIYVVVFFSVAEGMYLVENAAKDTKFTSLGDSLWYCVVTLSTVGYGDVYPVTTAGRVLAGIFILFTLTTIGFLLTAFNESVLEVKRMEEHGLIPTAMKGHVIVCGFGPLVRTALAELVAADRQVAVIVDRPEDIELARQWTHDEAFVTSGDPTQEVLRERLNALAAETAVVASADDTLNMITALNLRHLNPALRIVVALQREELRQTMKASGVTYVASPNEMSGRLVASAAFEPEVAHFIEDVTSGADEEGHDLQQFRAAPLAGKTVDEIRKELESIDGPMLVAVAQKGTSEHKVLAHPPKTLKVAAEDYLIVLTNGVQADRFSSKYHIKQGR